MLVSGRALAVRRWRRDDQPASSLVRHTRVDDRYQGVCYGRSDVELGPERDARPAIELADTIGRVANPTPDHQRRKRETGYLAERTRGSGSASSREVEPDFVGARLRKLGSLRTWDSIYNEVGDSMIRPDPRAGDLSDRRAARRRMNCAIESIGLVRPPAGRTALVMVVTHGGPIAALRGTLAGRGAGGLGRLDPELDRHLGHAGGEPRDEVHRSLRVRNARPWRPCSCSSVFASLAIGPKRLTVAASCPHGLVAGSSGGTIRCRTDHVGTPVAPGRPGDRWLA